MAKRRLIQGVAHGLLTHAVSRNRDIDGYWAVGYLCKIATDNGVSCVELDILTGVARPDFYFSNRLADDLYKSMEHILVKCGVDTSWVAKASLIAHYGQKLPPHLFIPKRTWGDPYCAKIKLTDDLGKQYVNEVWGYCSPHDPSRENQSNRFYPQHKGYPR